MSKLQELINKLCPNGVEYKELGELFDLKNGYTPSKNNDEYWTDGDIPWFRMEDIRSNGNILNDSIQHITRTAVKNKLFQKNSLMVATTATIGVHALITTDFICNQQLTNVAIKKEYKDKINIKFSYYYFDIIDKQCIKIANQGGGMPIVSLEKMKKLLFPVPLIEVQDEIVRILDNFTNLQAELQAELVRRIKQYEHVRNVLLTDKKIEKDIVELGKICNRLQGIPITASEMKKIENEDGGIKIFAGGKTVVNACLEDIPKKENIIYTPSIVVQSRGIIDFIYCDKPHTFKREMWAYTHENEITLKYVYYYLKNSVYKFREVGERMGSMPQISLDITEKFKINLPPIHIQEKIVYVLDNFEKVCKDLNIGLPAEIKERQKQYEFYRNLLLTFPNGIETILKKERKKERDN